MGGENKIPVDRFEGGHEAAASLKSEPESDGGNRPPTISNRQGREGGNATERSEGALTLIALRAKDHKHHLRIF